MLLNGRIDNVLLGIDVATFLLAAVYFYIFDGMQIFYIGILISIGRWYLLANKDLSKEINIEKYREISRAVFPIYYFFGFSIAQAVKHRDHIDKKIAKATTFGEIVDNYFDVPTLLFIFVIISLPYLNGNMFNGNSLYFIKFVELLSCTVLFRIISIFIFKLLVKFGVAK